MSRKEWIKFGSIWLRQQDIICFRESICVWTKEQQITVKATFPEPYSGAFTLKGEECKAFKYRLASEEEKK